MTIAKVQPFKDGNKHTAVFAGNGMLISSDTGMLLTIPFSDEDPSVAEHTNDTLARAYIFDVVK